MNHRPHPPHLLSVIFLVMVVFLKALLLEAAAHLRTACGILAAAVAEHEVNRAAPVDQAVVVATARQVVARERLGRDLLAEAGPKVAEDSPLAFELLLGSGPASRECEFECLYGRALQCILRI